MGFDGSSWEADLDKQNDFFDSEDREFEVDYPLEWKVMDLVQCTVTVIGLFANALLILLFATTSRVRSVCNTFLVQRALADMFVLIPFLFIVYFRIKMVMNIGQAMCKFLSVLIHVGSIASTIFLVAFALDSCQASKCQLHTLTQRRKTMVVVSAVAWVLAAAAGVAAYFLSEVVGHCIFNPLFSENVLLTTFTATLLFMLPLVLVWMFVCVCAARHSRHPQTVAEPVVREEGPNRRLLLALASSFTVFQAIFWLSFSAEYLFHIDTVIIILGIGFMIQTVDEALNAILVICLTRELRHRLTECLPITTARPSTSVPLGDM